MSEITAQLVKQLREMTDAGMMDCKKALVEVQGDLQKAVEYLREKGLSKAAKKADRVAAEGAISVKVASDFSQACMIEVNSETDFVAKNDGFKDLVAKTSELVFAHNISEVSALESLHIENQSFDEYLKTQIAKIGENIVVRKTCNIKANQGAIVNGYVHSNGRVGVIIALKGSQANAPKLAELARNLCMHAAAMKPVYIDYSGFSAEFLEKERVAMIAEVEKENEELKRLGKPLKNVPKYISRAQLTQSVLAEQEQILKDELKKQGKPEAIWDKIIPGQLERFIADNTLIDQRLTLLGQFFVMDDKELVFAHNISEVSALESLHIENQSFDEYLKTQIAKIGENIVVRKTCNIKANQGAIVNGYVHSNGRVGVIIALKGSQANAPKLAELARNLCMHAAAMKPVYIDYSGFSAEFLEKERVAMIAEVEKENEELKRLGKPLKNVPKYISRAQLTQSVLAEQEQILKDELKKQGKPEAIWDKIIPGQLERFIADNTLIDQRLTLLGQFFVMDDKKTIAQVLAEKSKEWNDTIEVAEYVRFELGEGIEKKAEDFAAEVAAQMQ